MLNPRWILLLLSLCLAFQACKKDGDDEEENLNNHLAECPGKFEGQYTGNITNGSSTYPNVKITVLTQVGNTSTITLVFSEIYSLSSDTFKATIECDLRSFTMSEGLTGFGSFSEDGSTLDISYSTYFNNAEGTFTKTKSSGFVMVVQREDSVYAGTNHAVPVAIRRYGDYDKTVTLNVNGISGSSTTPPFSAGFQPASSKPDFNALLTFTSATTAAPGFYYVTFTATDGTITDERELGVYFSNSNCTPFFSGSFSREFDFDCWQPNDTVTITSFTSSTFEVPDILVPVQINCSSGLLTIPRHTLTTDYEMEGTGSFTISGSYVRIELHCNYFYQGSFDGECDATYIAL